MKIRWRLICKCGAIIAEGTGYYGAIIMLNKCPKSKWYNHWWHSFSTIQTQEIINGTSIKS